jgi:hypothetical protein
LKRFYKEFTKPNSTCRRDGGSEDVEIAHCLRTGGVEQGKSLDEFNRERFHPLSFSSHYLQPLQEWLIGYSENKPVVVS